MNSDASYVQDMKTLGYSSLEAGFLRLVALHSGVFFRRHFMQFAGVKSGKRVDSFLKKLRSNKHCQIYSLNKNAAVYHVTSKAIYRCLDQPNLRHRRSHKIDYVKTKLLILDYVLANPTAEYMPTEEEKIHFFTKVLNIPLAPSQPRPTRHPIPRLRPSATSSTNSLFFSQMFLLRKGFISVMWIPDRTPASSIL
jgi:hypothetical protein